MKNKIEELVLAKCIKNIDPTGVLLMKTQRTKDLERLLAKRFNDRNDFFVFECTYGWYGKEIVDCIMYNCQREVHCFEIKQSVQDFHSKNKLSFFGNKNYFVMLESKS